MKVKVRIEPSGHEFETLPGETILEAALREGFRLPYSCRNGACGTCKGRVLEGDVTLGDYEAKALTEADRQAGWALFCRAVPQTAVVIEAREIGAAKDIVIKTLPARVVRLERLAPDVMRLMLKLPQNERLQYLAGQYIDILLKDGRRRGFSLANAPEEDELLELHIRHVPGGLFSGHVFESMQERALVRLEGPLGTFFLREDDAARPVILVAGGTGFAPMKALLEHAFRTHSTRSFHLYWGVRARTDLYLPELPPQWVRTHANFRYTPVLSQPGVDDHWEGRVGYVHTAVVEDYADLSGHEVYACGPPQMIEAARQAFQKAGLPDDRLYYDAFEYARDPG
ncbi:MAG: CDP-6-deoxy-delta-3,4-glucoseen reductase [Gammaproteobacteria bacterium]|nr:CDP-6-deoxy-delta-3,4-glucoseen reductase [Gammaproteobacteria bacterium]